MFLPSNITLQFGDSGDFVGELQRRLAIVRCLNESMINGFFDGNTVNAVTLFQSQCGLRADGIAGPETLRRLNGSISSAASSTATANNAEEEAQKKAAQTALTNELLAQQNAQLQQGQWGLTPAPVEAPAAYAPPVEVAPTPAAYVPPPPPQPAMMAPPIPPLMPLPSEAAYAPLPPQPSAATPQMPPTVPPAPAQHSAAHAPTAAPMVLAQPVPPQPVVAPLQSATPPQPAPTQAATPVEPTQAPGLLQKAVTMANALVQKLANYFEAKLPPDTLREVQEVGKAMARSGVKEVPIPADPTARAPEQPARGQAQLQAQQRG